MDEEAGRRVPAEPLLVEVEVGGVWWPGSLSEWQRWEAGWMGYVRYTVAPGEQYMRFVPASRVRPRNG